jgi:hypothetical protein
MEELSSGEKQQGTQQAQPQAAPQLSAEGQELLQSLKVMAKSMNITLPNLTNPTDKSVHDLKLMLLDEL